MDTPDAAETATTETVQQWTPPQIDCYDTRPEISAYAGGGDRGPTADR